MARRNDHKSIQHGSDALFDITCTPCSEDGLQEEATKYCAECQEYLCNACTKCHQRMRATKTHKLVGARQAKQNPGIKKAALTERCWYHPDRNVEMFCTTHDMVYCARCIATEHRACNGVIDIDHATQEHHNQTELQRLLTETDEIQEQLEGLREKKQKELEVSDEGQTKRLDRIQDLQRKMIDHIEKLGREATEVVKQKYTDVRNELETYIVKLNQMVGKVAERNKKLVEAVCLDNGSKFVQVKLGEKATVDAKKLFKECESAPVKEIKFTENTQLTDEMMKIESFGEIVKVEKQKKLDIRMADVRRDGECPCLIADLCQLPDGMIILVDQRNKKLKTLDEDYKVDGFWSFKGEPTGICCLGKKEIAVKFRSNKIVFYTIEGNLLETSTSKEFIPIEDGGSWGLEYFGGNLWATYRQGVRVYSTTGLYLKDIDSRSVWSHSSEPKMRGIPVHLAARNGSIFASTGLDGVVCLDKHGLVKFKLEDERLYITRGVCVTSRGTVFVSGFASNNVVMFSSEGKCLGEIVTKEMMPQEGPTALLYDFKKNCLLMACSNTDCILVVD